MALTRAHVIIVGCGGLGSPILQYLAGAGVGQLTLVDDDCVEASNLQRQTIYREEHLGRAKAEAAADWVRAFDTTLQTRAIVERVGMQNAARVLGGATLVVDGCDNFATRLAVSDSCVAMGIPLTSAALGRFQGQVANFAGHLPGEACYRCFVGDAFDAEDCDTCADDGVLGAMAGWVGTLAAMQAIRVLVAGQAALGDPQWGTLHLLDGLGPSLRSLTIPKDPECRGCSAR